VLRLIHGKLAASVYESHYSTWHSFLIILTLCHAVAWGTLAWLVNLEPLYQPIANYVNIIVIGIATASIQSLSTKSALAKIYVSILLVPTIVGAVWAGENLVMCVFAVLFWLYLMTVGNRFYREYIRAFKIEKELHEKQQTLHRLNNTDPLTQINNRRYFDQKLANLWQLSQQTDTALSLIILDIDHFKHINDNYGHPVGDICLKHFAHVVAPIVNQTGGELFRIGGEEFAVITTDIPESVVLQLAEAIRASIEAAPVQFETGDIAMTVSIGCCCAIVNQHMFAERFIEITDRALYKAKQSGRNQTICGHYPTPKDE